MTFKLIEQKAIKGVPTPDIIQIHSVTRDAAGHFYLSDEFNHRIVVLDQGGRCIRTFGRQGNGPGEFWYPRGIAIVEFEGDHQLVVCDAWNHRVQRFDLDGNFIGTFGSIGDGEDQFNEPVTVIPENDGRIWILDRCNHRIKLCSMGGETISIIGKHLTSEDEDRMNDPVDVFLESKETSPIVYGFNYPQAFAKEPDGNFVVVDTNNNRLCVVADKGKAIRFINLKGSEPPYFSPLSTTILENNIILVSGVNSSRKIIDLTHPWRRMEADLDTGDPLAPSAVFVDENGENANAFLFHGRKGIISKYSIEIPEQDLIDTPSQPIQIDSEKTSFEWANLIGGYWYEYLIEAAKTREVHKP